METFENRERGFENAFAHDEEVSFRVRIGALRKLGRWAAETLQREAPDAAAEAPAWLAYDRALEGADDERLLAGLADDLKGAGISGHRLRARLAACMQEASRDLHA
jgi:hypothetical protein